MTDPDAPQLPDEPEAAEDAGDDAGVYAEWTRPVDRFRRSAVGSVVAAGLLGVRDALEGRPKQEEVTIVSEAPAQPVDHIELVLDPDHPDRSFAVIHRPAPPAGGQEVLEEQRGDEPV